MDIRSIFIVLLVALFAIKFTNLVVDALHRYILNYFCYSFYLLFSLSKRCEILMLFCQLNAHSFRGCYIIRALAVHVWYERRTFEGLTLVKNWAFALPDCVVRLVLDLSKVLPRILVLSTNVIYVL